MDWLDRITGERRTGPFEPFAPGQWQYLGERGLSVRDTVAMPGDVLMPGQDGRCGAPNLGAIRCDPQFVADDDALRSLRLVGQRLRMLEAKSWSDWTAETPLLPTLDDALDEAPIERAIATKLGYLEVACLKPRTHLRLEEERLVVARCKRPSARAPSTLAARSEDWEHRTLWGVRPRRVLAVVRDELYDIYENRVAVALVDNLDVALLRRLRSVRRVVDLLKQRESYQHVLEDSDNYRRAMRILSLWSEALEDGHELEHAEAVQRKIVALRRRILALKNTLLYREIGGHRQDRMQLRMTNVLSHDEVYRRVAELWIAWEDHMRSLGGDPDVRWRQEQDAASGFERFVFLVVVRALDALGYGRSTGAPDAPMGAPGEWRLDGPVGSIVLRRDSQGVSVLSEYADAPLRFVSVPAALEASVVVGELVDSLRGRSVVLAALPADEPRAPMATRVKFAVCVDPEDSGPSLVSVAPWDIESVERVARRLRWYAWSAAYRRYPIVVGVPEAITFRAAPPSWIRTGDGTLQVVRPPASHERRWVELETKLESARREVTVAQARLGQCDLRDKRKRLHLRHDMDQAVAAQKAVEDLAARLPVGVLRAERLLSCPVCRTTANAGEFKHVDALFRCHCSECKATWGRRTCGACHGFFAFLDFPGNKASDNLLESDRRFGADVLALPVAGQVYICPHCGRRTDAAASD